ncbi:TetR/AcrR family transcriptional regulator C-terminal domain-containing protein [Nocardia sp. NPDC051750]|uniref:TetR/AcrR family transcriptional regulator C-terminal domain-containing protein n=1 Tax=Nocardia sp. NPDC051750 TaxID=3364325 RepID=UPI0037B60634
MSSTQRPDSPYRVIAAHIRTRIETGELRPGDRVPSIRQIARRWGVAVATATRVMATLRDEGLIDTEVGSGAVVSDLARALPAGPIAAAAATASAPGRTPHLAHVLRTAIAIADKEGLEAVSMRRLAAELGIGPMSLYRHITNKDELLVQMADEVFGELDPTDPVPQGWRAELESIARRQWQLCRRHLWLPRVVSFTRPLLAPNMMAQTEWTLRALDGLGLPMDIRMREALTLHALVLTAAASLAEEAEAEQNTGVTLDRWHAEQRTRAAELLESGRFPLLATIPAEIATDLDELFEYGLARHLDGLATLLTEPDLSR